MAVYAENGRQVRNWTGGPLQAAPILIWICTDGVNRKRTFGSRRQRGALGQFAGGRILLHGLPQPGGQEWLSPYQSWINSISDSESSRSYIQQSGAWALMMPPSLLVMVWDIAAAFLPACPLRCSGTYPFALTGRLCAPAAAVPAEGSRHFRPMRLPSRIPPE